VTNEGQKNRVANSVTGICAVCWANNSAEIRASIFLSNFYPPCWMEGGRN